MEARSWRGAVYDYGLGTRPNRRLAFENYLQAAKAGDTNGEYHVSVFYSEDRGVRKSQRQVLPWLRKAARKNDPHALYALGYFYHYGKGLKSLNFGLPMIRELMTTRKFTGTNHR